MGSEPTMEQTALLARIAVCESRLDDLAEHLEKLGRRLDAISDTVRYHGNCVDVGRLGHPPLEALRAAGVTRYQVGELVIELNPEPRQGPVVVPPVVLDDAPPDAPEPIESPSGIEVDHEALRVKLEERKRATGRAKQ